MDTVSIDSRSLYRLLGSPRAPTLVDTRKDKAYDADDRLLPGALRTGPDPSAITPDHPRGRPIVVYCVYGHEVGQDAAAMLRAKGFDARYLEGGIDGWRKEGLPTIKRRPDWRVPGGSRWITRERPKIDRIACPWLVRRFLDPLARFDYVPRASVFDEARAREAIPYDIDDAVLTHRGERCSFDAFIEDFELHDAALDRLATIVRGADTGRPELAPQCSALLATSADLSRRYADDHEMLENAMPVYDALYAECREAVVA
jgi:rhodanese-related sulfurtransferase